MARWIAAFLVLFLFGCATQQSVDYSGVPDIACTPVEAHVTNNDESVPASFICPTGGARANYAANSCAWVDGYYRKDGTYVPGHTRCRYNNPAPITYTPGAGSGTAPCVTGYCGSVNVRGYYRKDGVYVRPHTRSRGRR